MSGSLPDMDSDGKRFEVIYEQKGISNTRILVDRQTQVCYLCYAGGLTALIDADGKPMLQPPSGA